MFFLSCCRFRVKEISRKQNMVAVSLFYSPKTETLRRKFGTLPVTYVRVNVKTDKELELFERAARMYKFDLNECSDVEESPLPPAPPQKRLKTNEGSSSTTQQELPPPATPMKKLKKSRKYVEDVEEDLRKIEQLRENSIIDLDCDEFSQDLDPNNQYESQIF